MVHLAATPEHCFWGYLDPDESAVAKVESGTELHIEAVTHHAGDAPDLMMDDAIRELWDGIPEAERTPGVHIMTGPIEVIGAMPGDTLRVDLLSMSPRLAYGSNCAAHWGLLYDVTQKERITVYELTGGDDLPDGCHGFGPSARPVFGFDFVERELYDLPGVISPPGDRTPFGRIVKVPVRPHVGVMGVAPPETGRRSSIPPGVWGGNVDNWRFGPGVTIHYPVFHPGAGFYLGDPHFAQGDGELCGTAIEASLDVRLRLSVRPGLPVSAPLLETPAHVYTHGFGDDLDEAMRMAADEMLRLLVDLGEFTYDEAYSLASVAVDVGVTQVVDGIVGCHAAVSKDILGRPLPTR